MSDWVQPKENTLSSFRHGLSLMDGIEFDIRSTADGELVIHHDRTLAVSEELRAGLPEYFEQNSSADVTGLGFPAFQDLLDDPTISAAVKQQAKVLCIEVKLPHPSSRVAGTWLNSRKDQPYMQRLLRQAAEMLEQAEYPRQNIIFYSFYRRINAAARAVDLDWSVSALRPVLPHFGGKLTARVWVIPEFITRNLKTRIRQQLKAGSPMVPCALEYLVPPTNWIPIGRRLGVEGKPLAHLTKVRGGYPFYVWPGRTEWEHRLHEAGLTYLTDDADPNHVTLPEGVPRWTKPATQPLDDSWRERFASTPLAQHAALIEEARRELPAWHELSAAERRSFLKAWKKRWSWSRSLEALEADASESQLPWEAVRVIGHRGSGKSPRPIMF